MKNNNNNEFGEGSSKSVEKKEQNSSSSSSSSSSSFSPSSPLSPSSETNIQQEKQTSPINLLTQSNVVEPTSLHTESQIVRDKGKGKSTEDYSYNQGTKRSIGEVETSDAERKEETKKFHGSSNENDPSFITSEVKALENQSRATREFLEQGNSLMKKSMDEMVDAYAGDMQSGKVVELIDISSAYTKAREVIDHHKSLSDSRANTQHAYEIQASVCNEVEAKLDLILSDSTLKLSQDDIKDLEVLKNANNTLRSENRKARDTELDYYKSWATAVGIVEEEVNLNKSNVRDFANPMDEMPSYTDPED